MKISENTADLEFPATDPANAGVRGEFLLGHLPARPRRQPYAAAGDASTNTAGEII